MIEIKLTTIGSNQSFNLDAFEQLNQFFLVTKLVIFDIDYDSLNYLSCVWSIATPVTSYQSTVYCYDSNLFPG